MSADDSFRGVPATEYVPSRSDQDLDTIADALEHTSGADDWQVELLQDNQAQLYVIGNRVESQRTVTNERAAVTIYNDHTPAVQPEGDPMTARGFTTRTLLASDLDREQLRASLSDGVTMAALTDNPPFGLPEPSSRSFPSVLTQDP